MSHDHNPAIAHCEQRIAEEELLSKNAESAEVGEKHAQMAMLYRTQLAVLKRGWEAMTTEIPRTATQ